MKILILSISEKLYSTRRLVEAAQSRGHEVLVANTLECYMDISSEKPRVLYKDLVLNDFDAVIPRIGVEITFYGLAILRQFEMMGVFAVNDSIAIGRSRDKLRSLQLLSRKGLGLPRTSFAHSTEMTEKIIEMVGGAPVVVKLLEGTQGRGVVLAETRKAAESVVDAFREMNANFLVQEFIKEANGTDIRCFVVGDKVVASMIRRAKEGEFRSNIHRGASSEAIKITPKERETAVMAAKVMGLGVAGVDLLRAKSGPMIMEVNSSPGLEGIEGATKKDVASMIIDFIEKNATKTKKNTRGIG